MNRKLLWLLPLLLLLSLLFLRGGRGPAPRHIFLITLDTTRADAVDYRLGEESATPNLAALAAAGVRFDNAYSVIPITLPSHASMFYSLPPHALKIYTNGQRHAQPFPALAEIMKRKGYATGAVVSLAVLKREFGLDQGFDQYLDRFPQGMWYRSAEEVNRDALALVRLLRHGRSFIWLHYSDPHEPYFPPGNAERFTVSCRGVTLYSGSSSDQPALKLELLLNPGTTAVDLETAPPGGLPAGGFIGVNLGDLQVETLARGRRIEIAPSPDLQRHDERLGHFYYSTRATRSRLDLTLDGETPCRAVLSFKYQVRVSDEAKRSGYRREIRYLDAQIGLLLEQLKRLGVYDQSSFLVLGDHGEGLGEYKGHFGHIHYLNKVYTHVPFFVSGRRVHGRGRRGELVSNLDVAPTLLRLAGIRPPRHMAGRGALAGGDGPKLFLETYHPEAFLDTFAVIRFPWQVIFYPGQEKDRVDFFHLEREDGGTTLLPDGAVLPKLRSEMVRSVREIATIVTANKRRRDTLDKKTMAALKSLGYL